MRYDYNYEKLKGSLLTQIWQLLYLGQLGAAAWLGLVKERNHIVGALHTLVLFKLTVEKVKCNAVRVAARDARHQVLERSARLVRKYWEVKSKK